MAAALFRAGTGLSARCIHRELCRVMGRPQTAQFSSKPSGRDPPRRTHIKKPKAQPAEDANKVLEKLVSKKRQGTAPPAAGEVLSKTAAMMNTSAASSPDVAANGDSLEIEEEKASKAEAVILESTLAEVKADVGNLETEALQETCDSLEKGAEELAKELQARTPIEDVSVLEDSAEVDTLRLDSVFEATDASKAETSVILEATSDTDQELKLNDELINQKAETQAAEQEGNVLEAMSLESVTLGEVEASLGTLESRSLSETSNYLEKEAAILAKEKRMETEEGTTAKEMNEALNTDPLSLAEADTLPGDLQTEALMEGLLFNVPGHVAGARGSQITEEAVTTDILDAASVDKVAAETDYRPAPPLKEELLVQEGEGEGAAGSKEDAGMQTDLDPVQRLFLEKIREYRNMRRLNAGLLEAEPDYQKHLSEEMAKLQRLYGGGDLSCFPQFIFINPTLDQDSK